jgi:perosamine synthetase
MNVPIARTVFTDQEFENILKPLRSGWVVQGPFVKEFETKWSNYTGSRHSLAVSNCTTGLHLSLAALGVGPGDEVIVPAFTWVATANAVESLGARPVFCDISLETFNLDVAALDACLTPKTRAIIPVHLFGLAADMNPILELARRHNLWVVEDAACGFGSRYRGAHVGTLGDTGCFSFHPRKAITTGEGGMVCTQDEQLASKLSSMRDHGASITDHQRHLGPRPYLLPEFPVLGFNYRMTDIQASIGSTQMDRAAEIHAARSHWAERYDQALGSLSALRLPFRAADYVHGYQAYVCLFEPGEASLAHVRQVNERRNAFMDCLQQSGVSTRPGTHAVHMLGYYASRYGIAPQDYPNAYLADHCSVAFPLFPGMSEQEFEHVTSAIVRYFR